MSNPPAPLPNQRVWFPTAVSAALHALLLALAVGLTRQTTPEPREQADGVVRETPRIDMIYVPEPEVVPPAPPPTPRARPSPPPPPPRPPPVRRSEPEPEPNAPPESIRSEGTDAPDQTSESTPKSAEAEATLESEARRIFGRPRLAARRGVGPEAIRPMEAWVAERPDLCTPRPTAPRDAGVPVQLGTAVGRIFRQDNGKPLAGAHLQMMGTPYVAFTDDQGEYQFQFDLALVDNCRAQYVRVSAPGYESRLLVLMVGPNRSEDVLLRRR